MILIAIYLFLAFIISIAYTIMVFRSEGAKLTKMLSWLKKKLVNWEAFALVAVFACVIEYLKNLT